MINTIPFGWKRFIEVGMEIAPFGAEFKKYANFLEKSQKWDRTRIEKHQLSKLKKLVLHCYENVPYYTNLFDSQGINPYIKSFEDFKKIPVLTKETVLKNPNAFLASNFGKYFPIAYSSSGTTGNKFEFYLDQVTWDVEKAAIWRHFHMAGYNYGNKAIMLYPFDQDVAEYSVFNPYTAWQMINSKVLNEDIWNKHLKFIEKTKPKMIWGYPSVLHNFAKFLSRHNKRLTIPIILTTSEPIYAPQQKLIEKHIGGKIFDWYGMSEHTISANHCEFHNYHINEEYVYMEFLNSKSHEKSVIGTNLYNYSMPLLRYVSEDFANIANIICKCGRKTQILEKIIGRKRDIIQTKKGDYILRHSLFLFNHPDIEQFQIRQTNKDKITIYIVPKNKINLEKIESIQKEFGEFLDFNANVNVKLLKDIPKAKSGKTLYFISDLGAHE